MQQSIEIFACIAATAVEQPALPLQRAAPAGGGAPQQPAGVHDAVQQAQAPREPRQPRQPLHESRDVRCQGGDGARVHVRAVLSVQEQKQRGHEWAPTAPRAQTACPATHAPAFL